MGRSRRRRGRGGRPATHGTGASVHFLLGVVGAREEAEAEGSGGHAHVAQGGARGGEHGALLWDPPLAEQAPGPGS